MHLSLEDPRLNVCMDELVCEKVWKAVKIADITSGISVVATCKGTIACRSVENVCVRFAHT